MANQKSIFLGKAAEDLGQLVAIQSTKIFEQEGIIIPLKSCSTLSAINQMTEASVTEIASCLNQSHQLVKQKMPKLKTLGLIGSANDPYDKRRTVYTLTTLGLEQLEKLSEITPYLLMVYDDVYDQIGVNLREKIEDTIGLLQTDSLISKFYYVRDKSS